VKAPIALSALSRERRIRGRSTTRSRASTKANETRRRNSDAPSQRWTAWRTKPETKWNANDALGCYAAAYVEEVGSEDVELRTKEAIKRCTAILRKLLDDLEPKESPRAFVQWAVRECVHGEGYPKDGVPSVVAICYRRILLKRWRIRGNTTGDGVEARGREWIEG